jgi:hypothetical protein
LRHPAERRCRPAIPQAALSLAAAYPGVTVPHGSAPIAWRVIAWPVRVARPVIGVRPIIIGRSQRTADDGPGRHSSPKKRPAPPAFAGLDIDNAVAPMTADATRVVRIFLMASLTHGLV